MSDPSARHRLEEFRRMIERAKSEGPKALLQTRRAFGFCMTLDELAALRSPEEVAALERETRADERERCAKVARSHRCKPDNPLHRGTDNTARLIEEEIRSLQDTSR